MYRFQEFYIPDRMMPGLTRWINDGICPGNFLQAILKNDFKEACALADHENMRNLPAYAAFLYNEAPAQCHGSVEKFNAWHELHRKRRENEKPEADQGES